MHGGGQGFESPRLHLKSSIIFPGNRKQDKRDGVRELPPLWQETPLTELLRRVLGVSLLWCYVFYGSVGTAQKYLYESRQGFLIPSIWIPTDSSTSSVGSNCLAAKARKVQALPLSMRSGPKEPLQTVRQPLRPHKELRTIRNVYRYPTMSEAHATAECW